MEYDKSYQPFYDGNVYILLQKKAYFPGEQVNGTLELDLLSDHEPSILYLEFSG